MLELLKRWLPVALWMALIFYFSSYNKLEVTSEPVGNFVTRKIAHLSEYGILALLIFRAQGYTKMRQALILTILYGGSDELHQAFVPGRTALPTDIIFDALGASLGGLAWKYLPTHLKKLRI